ncbi:hypothetical protein [Paenibacillus sp. FSL H3-0286]|uniref:hypothetical protein n=1 Tax=Paenibacillus sp. FSL H3-0286 TaxID=2921427 RepID=UPI00324C66A9
MGFPATTGSLKTKVSDMKLGDYIVCKYVASSGVVGVFSELGTSTATEIPVIGSATPNGSFYLVKVDKGLLAADRVIQHLISWEALNSGKVIQGIEFVTSSINQMPIMTDYNIPSNINITKYPSNQDGNGQAFRMFDSDTNTQAGLFTVMNGGTFADNYIQIEMDIPRCVNQMTVTFPTSNVTIDYYPSGWTFQGSIDGNIWDTLYVQTGLTAWQRGEVRGFKIINNTSYKYYRLFRVTGPKNIAYFGEMKLEDASSYATIRSLTGGVTFADANGNGITTTTDLGYGMLPTNNEWDRYISNFPSSKIQVGKTLDDVFHWNGVATWSQDTPNLAIKASTSRIARGYDSLKGGRHNGSAQAVTFYGFRPVFEYQE